MAWGPEWCLPCSAAGFPAVVLSGPCRWWMQQPHAASPALRSTAREKPQSQQAGSASMQPCVSLPLRPPRSWCAAPPPAGRDRHNPPQRSPREAQSRSAPARPEWEARCLCWLDSNRDRWCVMLSGLNNKTNPPPHLPLSLSSTLFSFCHFLPCSTFSWKCWDLAQSRWIITVRWQCVLLPEMSPDPAEPERSSPADVEQQQPDLLSGSVRAPAVKLLKHQVNSSGRQSI